VTGEQDAKAAVKTSEDAACGGIKSSLAEMLRWSNDVSLNTSQIMASMMGMVGPVALGVFFGNLGFGMLASYGAMVVGGAESGGRMRQQAVELTGVMLVGTAAVFAGSLMGGHGWWTGGFIVITACLAALLGGMSRPAAQASARFMILTIIGTSVGEGSHPHSGVLALVFATGSLWGIVVALSVNLLLPSPSGCPQATGAALMSHKERLKRWGRSLAHFSGWQYTLRITLSMLAAAAITMLLHKQRAYWVFLTIAIVLQRSFAAAFSRIVQRGTGTVAGVLLGSLLLLWTPPDWGVVLIVGMLAALRPVLKDRNYAMYAMIMTPLIVLVISQGRPVTGSLLFERLLDTAIGCIIAITLGYMVWPNRKESSRKGH